ncbi:atrophin-1 [Kryptolebias marmoratus]|uniref:atrophin-1 n=1 Tax=Kryptolebias marmoratus TaxID=37003 RepID=UPI0007F8ABA1|nr:atrophin-1 [Kryptolebias marmoratus]
MASGLILWVSYIALLLSAIVGCSAAQGWIYRARQDSKNLEPDDSNTIYSDQGEGALVNQLSGLLPPNYVHPSVAQPPSLIPVGQIPATAKGDNEVEKLVNGATREWESNPFQPITFPLKPWYPKVEPAQQTPTFNQPQLAPLHVYMSKKPAPPSLVESSFENQNVATKPIQPSPYVAASSPSFQPWQPASTDVNSSPSGSLNQPLYTAPSPGGDFSKPVFVRPPDNSEDPLTSVRPQTPYGPTLEQVSHKYPSVGAEPQSSAALNAPEWYGPGNNIGDGSTGYTLPSWKPSFQGPVGGLPYYSDWLGFPFSSFGDNLYYGQMPLRPQNFVTNSGKYWVPQMSYPQRASPRPLRKSFVVRSKSGYQRQRFLQSKTTYVPGFEMPQRKNTPASEVQRKYPKRPTSFRGPARNSIRRRVQDPTTLIKI